MTICILSVAAFRTRKLAERELDDTRKRLGHVDSVPFERAVQPPIPSTALAYFQNTRNVRAAAEFEDAFFAATEGGLVRFGSSDAPTRRFTVTDGLPESDLTALAEFNGLLFIGTRTQGLLSFDGERFEQFRPNQQALRGVTALLADAGRLLVATNGGLLEFDGNRFLELKAERDARRIPHAVELRKYGSRLYVGTYSDGLWVFEAGVWRHFTTEQGLASNRIVGMAEIGNEVFVACDFGLTRGDVSEAFRPGLSPSDKPFSTAAVLPTLSGLIEREGRLWACRDDGSLFAVERDGRHSKQFHFEPLERRHTEPLSGCRLTIFKNRFWMISENGLFHGAFPESGSNRLSLAPFQPEGWESRISSNVVSALSLDDEGRLWIGTFRDGIDLCAPDGKPLGHVRTPTLREINTLTRDASSKKMIAATSQGVFRFQTPKNFERLTADDGLPSDSATATVVLPNNFLACGSTRGLSLETPDGFRTLTTVQGLPSNTVSCLLPLGKSIFVGTLGGLAEVADGRVVRRFKDSNSELTHNWTTALCSVGERLFIGTYGGGVFELTRSGKLHAFAAETGGFAVSPNAMFCDGERLYAGTTDGVRILDLNSQRWTRLKRELPSNLVLSVTGNDAFVYFGTTGGVVRIDKSFFREDVSTGGQYRPR